MKFPNDSRGDVLIRDIPKFFRYLRGEKTTRGNFNFKRGVKTWQKPWKVSEKHYTVLILCCEAEKNNSFVKHE